MENVNEKTVQVYIDNYSGEKPVEVIVRKGEAARQPDPLAIKAPEKIDVTGVISTPLDWLRKRVDTIDQEEANIKVDRENMTIVLTVNERDFYEKSVIVGKIRYSDQFLAFRINDGEKGWVPSQLGQFIRLNRAMFPDKEKCAALVSLLKNFQAKCNADIQKQQDPSGARAEVYRMNVESNLPKAFTVELPIFRGTAKQAIEVEFDHYIVDSHVMLQLVSPGANEFTEIYRESELDKVLNQIREVAPDIAILEL